jgi:hypothetical protein
MTQHIHPNFIEDVLRYEQARKAIAQPEEEHIDPAPIYGSKWWTDRLSMARCTRGDAARKNRITHMEFFRGTVFLFGVGVNNEEGD